MLKKYWVLVTLLAILLLFSSVKIIKLKIGDIRPAFFPPRQNISEILSSPHPNPQLSEIPEFPFKLPPGFKIGIFAKNLDSPRDLEFTPNETLLVSLPSSGKVIALPDSNQDGLADQALEILTGLNRPHGLAFYENKLYVAEETQIARYAFDEKNFTAVFEKKLFAIPKGGRHFTRTIAFNNVGQMFVSIGSTCDVCVEKNPRHGSMLTSDQDGNNPRVFATGLRNSVFIAVNPETNALWGTEMGRDFLGDSLPPDELNIIEDGKNYGWPVCYGDKIHDTAFDKNVYKRNPCEDTTSSIYKIPAHSAPLGLTFIDSSQFPSDWQGDLLVSYHGSWNSSVPVGYKVVRLMVEGNNITGEADFMTGFLKENEAVGRPVDLIFDKDGNLFISDDKAGVIYRIYKS